MEDLPEKIKMKTDEAVAMAEDLIEESTAAAKTSAEKFKTWVTKSSKKSSAWVKENKVLVGAIVAAVVSVAVVASLVKAKK
jgi:hypothetical protein